MTPPQFHSSSQPMTKHFQLGPFAAISTACEGTYSPASVEQTGCDVRVITGRRDLATSGGWNLETNLGTCLRVGERPVRFRWVLAVSAVSRFVPV